MRRLFFSLLFLIPFAAIAERTDSLEAALKNAEEDTVKLFLLDELVWEYLYSDINKAESYAEHAIRTAISSNAPGKFSGRAHHSMATVFLQMNKNDSALIYFSRAIKIFYEAGIEEKCASSYNGVGNVYLYQGIFEKSLENYLKSLRILEKHNSPKQKLGLVIANIGIVYFNLENYEKAIEYYNRALKIAEETADSTGIASAYTNLGNIYKDLEKYDESEKYFMKGVDIFTKLGEDYGSANCYANLGGLAKRKGDSKKAMEYYQLAYEIFYELKSDDGVCAMYYDFGCVYLDQKEYEKAIDYLNKSIALARKINSRNRVMESYSVLHEVYDKMGNPTKAYSTLLKYMDAKDSVLNEENTKSIAQMQTIYETEKKEQQLIAKEAELKKNQAELKQKTIQRNAILSGGVIALVLTIVIYRSYREKKKANIAITLQKEIIEQKNKDITDSINYAQRIQSAILPSKEFIRKLFPQSFVLYSPRDIVSGDFYFFAEVGNRKIACVCDCTGHGVPGAFMSMIGNDLLHRIVNELNVTDTGRILDELHKGIMLALNQDAEQRTTRDGMDVALFCRDESTGNVFYSGAVRPLYYFDASGFHELKGDRESIGGSQEKEFSFTSYPISAREGSTYYLFSDGYADQFGGDDGKKFMAKRFKELLGKVQEKSMEEQGEILSNELNEWKRDKEQVDDILVIGIRM